MDQYELIRTAKRVYKKSIREIARETGHHRQTIRKALAGLEPKYRRKKSRECPIMGPVSEIVKSWLQADPSRPPKQRHTARRVYSRLVEEYGFKGGESTVRQWVRGCKAQVGGGATLAVIPLDPEVAREAEVDWGTGWVRLAGEERQVKLFCMRSRYSGQSFVRAYPWERQEMFFDGHMHAFAYYQGIFPELVYDNLTSSVKQILRGKGRVEQERFIAFRSYYTFQARYCNPEKGREKGGVEGLIGFARRNFLVPLPEVRDFEELNALLLARCLDHSRRKIQGREEDRTIEERHAAERTRLLPLPERPFDNHKPVAVRISRYQTAQVDRNRYSVPTRYVGRWLWAHVGCEQIVLYSDQQKVAEHPRLFGNSKWQIDPLHYLEVIYERIGAFESARPIRQWRRQWPEQYERLLSYLRRRQGDNKGTREFVRILQLHERYSREQVEQAVTEALEWQAYRYEAVKHFLARQENGAMEPVPLAADLMPGITDRPVPVTELAAYNQLLSGGDV